MNITNKFKLIPISFKGVVLTLDKNTNGSIYTVENLRNIVDDYNNRRNKVQNFGELGFVGNLDIH